MLQLGSLFTQFHVSSRAPEHSQSWSPQPTQTPADFLQRVRKLAGLKKDDVHGNLRIPDRFQPSKDDVNIVILTAQGIFCIDVKTWRGKVSAHNQNWHVQVKEDNQNFTNICIEQTEDPLRAIKTKTSTLRDHLRRNGVSVHHDSFFPRVIFLSPECELDEDLTQRSELISHSQIDNFLASFREGYMAWMSDAVTPSWLSGHLSYSQMGSVRQVLRRLGTWDVVQLHSGEQLKGDYQGCQYIAVTRQETDTLEFSTLRTLSPDALWALLGHTPQVTVKLYKRGSHSWLGKSLNATTTIPPSTHVLFRLCGEEADAKIPANTIRSITLSI